VLLDRPIPEALFLEKSAGKHRFQILRSERERDYRLIADQNQ